MRHLTIASLLLAVSLLGACTLVPTREPSSLYALPAEPLAEGTAVGTAPEMTLHLATPQAGRLLDSARIVVLPEPHRPSVYQGARWTDDAPVLLRDRLLDGFREDGRLSRLTHGESSLPSDLTLVSDLRAFQSEYINDLPDAVVTIDVRLVDSRSRRLLASQRFSQRQAAATTEIGDVVAALGLATDRLVQELVDWTLGEAHRHR
ncbi:hypothetical protein HOP52_05265 [Halomonas campisalis]|uniref:ABC-type transport auxiliary lipoprotein component domain-containing protein n=1 Tax=Billgrantia campisalis TaxID=74661 RepID=A0ABS9P5Z8_9GAMM|nr:ABC-type transport auxiliary lipoprotein family protein [Halomonas campisalis]MCG6657188.1 hypothetical protein [Halomonas campisalis]MDR5862373.1 ABC-type transport auxiliary lipoprotein family protein [Halomonas campisalis]